MTYSYFPSIPKFIIAAINGPCAGLGLIIPLYADLRFAAESAVFTTAFAQRGLIAEVGRLQVAGRPVLYGTTEDFLMQFGLPDVGALPPLPQLETTPDAVSTTGPPAP